MFAVNDHRDIRMRECFDSFPKRYRIEKRFFGLIVVLFRMPQIGFAVIVDADIQVHASILFNCLPQ